MDDKIRRVLIRTTPRARLERLIEDIKEAGATADLAGELDYARMLLERTGNGPADALRAQIESIRARFFAWLWAHDPDRARGCKTIQAARMGGEERASQSSFRDHAPAMQRRADDLARVNPCLSRSDITKKVAQEFGCSIKTIKRHAKNPHRK